MTKPISKGMTVRALVLTLVLLTFSWLATMDTRGWKFNPKAEVKSAKSYRDSDERSKGEVAAAFSNGPGELKLNDRRKRYNGSRAMHTVQVSQQAVDAVVAELKKQIALPFDITVVFEACGDQDAYYDKDRHKIIVCHELIESYYYLFSSSLKATSARNEATKSVTMSIFLHELGHALIDSWELPITGREEDAADQFAILWLINRVPEGEQMVLTTARAFEKVADLEKWELKDYSDPHSPDGQRFYDTICLLYGHKPQKYEYLIENGTLPVERAFKCEEDYARLNKSWQTLLAPHLVNRTPSLDFDTLSFLPIPAYSSHKP